MSKRQEFETKFERVTDFLADNDLDGVVLATTANIAWLGCGANTVVNAAQETGVGTLVVTADGVSLVSKNIETERLETEELDGIELTDSLTYPWYEPHRRAEIIGEIIGGGRFAADDGTCDLPGLPPEWNHLRYTLTAPEIERYRAVGRDASTAMEEAARQVDTGMNESEIAGLISRSYRSRGLLPAVLLVAADERIRQWRHPLPKDLELERYVMLVACGRRQGLVTAVTRFVHFGELTDELRHRHDAVCEVDSRIIDATTPGRPVSDVFDVARTAYADAGFADEWQLHHQGGAIGYEPREYIVDPSCKETVMSPQAFAWNPSICGTKSEDTVLITENGPEFITSPSEDWPGVEVQVHGTTYRRADMLVR
ncbi:MAG: M24 family metallopeptidase [Planctomycetota bacterium]